MSGLSPPLPLPLPLSSSSESELPICCIANRICSARDRFFGGGISGFEFEFEFGFEFEFELFVSFLTFGTTGADPGSARIGGLPTSSTSRGVSPGKAWITVREENGMEKDVENAKCKTKCGEKQHEKCDECQMPNAR